MNYNWCHYMHFRVPQTCCRFRGEATQLTECASALGVFITPQHASVHYATMDVLTKNTSNTQELISDHNYFLKDISFSSNVSFWRSQAESPKNESKRQKMKNCQVIFFGKKELMYLQPSREIHSQPNRKVTMACSDQPIHGAGGKSSWEEWLL